MPLSTLEDRIAKDDRADAKAFDAKLRAMVASGEIKKERVPALVAERGRRFQEKANARRQELQRMIQARREAMGSSGTLAALRPVTSAVMNFGESASFGLAPKIGGAIAGALSPTKTVGEGIEEAQLQLEALSSPTAGARMGALAGTIGGAFAGPRAVVGRGVDTLARLGAAPFAARAAQAGTLGRGIFEIGKAAAATSANVGVSELIEGVVTGRDAEQIADRVKLGLMFAGPLSVVSGGLSTAFRTREVDQAGMALLQRAQRIMPNFRPTPDVLRQGSETQGFFRSLANVPGGRGVIARYMSERIYTPIRDALDDMQRAIGPSNAGGRAAKALGEIVPPEGARSFANVRKGIQAQAFQAEGGEIVDPNLWRGVLGALGGTNKRARLALGSEGPRGSSMSSIVSSIQTMNKKFMRELHAARAAGRAPRIGVKVQDLENIRQRLGELAGYEDIARATRDVAGISARDSRDARVLYHAVTQAMRQQSPAVDQAFNATKALRAAQKELEPLVGAARNFDPDQLVSQVFSGKNPVRRLRLLRRRMSGAENEALAGAYFGDFLRQLSRDAGDGRRLLTQTMRNAFNGNGRFRAALFDEVVGGPKTRRDLMDLAEILERTAPARAEGSPTAGRALDALVASGTVNLPKLALDVMHDPKLMQGFMARGVGMIFSYTALKSVLEGGLSRDLQALATGGVARSPTTIAAGMSTTANEVLDTRR